MIYVRVANELASQVPDRLEIKQTNKQKTNKVGILSKEIWRIRIWMDILKWT